MQPETVLITGCSSGIGRATARAFLDEEWRVYATARNPADVEQLGEEGCDIATLDVTDDGDVARVVDRIIDEDGRLDCLVNNAGYAQLGPVEDVPTDALDEQFDVNLNGPHRLIRAVLPHMREQGEGTIVNVSSVSGRVAAPGAGAYAASKFALEALSDSLRAEVDEYGVDVVVVEPGPVDTKFSERTERELDRLDRSGAYESFYRILEDTRAIGGGGPGAVSADRVAEDVLDAASSTKPPTRIPVGTVARAGVLARFVPDRLRDRAYGLADRLR